MKCSELDQDILLLQHGELSPWRAFFVSRHIQGCPRCQDKQDGYRQIGRHIAASLRQDAGLPPFVFRGEPQPAAPIQKIAPRAPRLRPSVAIGATAIAAIVAAGAYVYRAMALTPDVDLDQMPTRIVYSGMRTKNPKDSHGDPTIFPYSTPVMDHHCDKATH